MPNYRRPRPSVGPVFFTVCLADRTSTALVDHIDILREAVRVTKRDRPFDILAWVVLPDHMHCIWDMPETDRNYSQRWGRIKARFSRDARRAGLVAPVGRRAGFIPPSTVADGGGGTSPALRGRARHPGREVARGQRPRKGEVGIWQTRFWEHHIRDEHDLAAHLRYCWWNPVKHGLVESPEGWEYSSVHEKLPARRMAEQISP